MTVEQLTKISDANLAIARLQEKIEQERGVLSGILRECDHLNPDGSSAVRTGLPGTSSSHLPFATMTTAAWTNTYTNITVVKCPLVTSTA
jgi:hypothetical protein